MENQTWLSMVKDRFRELNRVQQAYVIYYRLNWRLAFHLIYDIEETIPFSEYLRDLADLFGDEL